MIEHGIITPERAAIRLGEPVANNADQKKLYMAVNIAPIELSSTKAAVSNQVLAVERIDMAVSDDLMLSKDQAKIVKRLQAIRETVASKYVDKYQDLLSRQKADALRKIEINLSLDEVTAQIDFGLYDDEYLRLLKSTHTSTLQRTLKALEDEYNTDINSSISNPVVSITLDTLQSRFYAHDFNGIVKTGLERIMAKAMSESWNIQQIEAAINSTGMFSKDRAHLIARTEAQVASDKASLIAYRHLGVKTVDVIGCTQFETYSDCGRAGISIEETGNLTFHPNHKGVIVPASR
jgi:hypothetical protein